MSNIRFFDGISIIAIDRRFYSFHIGVRPNSWVWGRDTDEYDGVLDYIGFGPLFLIAMQPGPWLRTQDDWEHHITSLCDEGHITEPAMITALYWIEQSLPEHHVCDGNGGIILRFDDQWVTIRRSGEETRR